MPHEFSSMFPPECAEHTALAKEPLGPDTQGEADSRVRAIKKS